jgi:ABC-2 type transport system permease protein
LRAGASRGSMAEAALPVTVASPAGGRVRQTGVLGLLAPKWRTGRRRAQQGATVFRGIVLGTVALVFWALLFGIVFRMLAYFRAAPGIGDLLAMKLLSLILLALLSILLLSNIITSLSAFFLAKDLELLAAAPVDGLRVYTARFVETMVNSSWVVILVLVPILSAYALSYGAGWSFLFVALATVLALLILPAVLGAAVTLALVNVFPARRARDVLALLALIGAAGLIVLFRMMRPEQLARPEGFRSLSQFVGEMAAPQSVWLPSEWAARALFAPLAGGTGDLFALLLLASTAAAAFVVGAWLHEGLYRDGFSRAQEGAEQKEGAAERKPRLEPLLRALPVTARTLVAKDIRTFFRDTSQWSQLILLVVLVVVYIYNIRVLPLFSGEEVGFFLVNVVSFLNLGLAGFVLAAIAARFLFPAVSLEGRTLWLLRSSPLSLRALLWSKFWVGVLPLLVLAVALTVGTNLILRVSGFMMVLSVATMIVCTFAIAALALGFGALFPKYDADNAAEISTGFGGLLYMMVAVGYLVLVIVLEAWPVYAVLQAQMTGEAVGSAQYGAVAFGLGGALLVSVAAVVLPLRAAVRRIEGEEG